MNLWEQLGLDGPTQDINAIKKAYAKKAHEINPEDNPEGFVELHKAYKTAIGIARAQARTRTQVKEETAKKETLTDQESQQNPNTPTTPTDQYDFSDLSPISPDDHLNNIITFRKENKIETAEQVSKLSRRALIIITRELYVKYATYAAYRRDPEVWHEFWEEPAVKYFERDPEFRKWVVRNTYDPEHKKNNAEIAASLESLPEEHKWFKGKDPVVPAEPKKKMNPVLLFILSAVGLFALSLVIGFAMSWTNMLRGSEPHEIVLLSLGITLVAILMHLFEKMGKKK